MIKLRPYQIEAIQTIKDGFTKHFRQYVEMPTGSGKTVTFLTYAKENHKKILIIVPSTHLLKQVYESSLLFYHHSEISMKGDGHYEEVRKIHICVIHSIRGDYLEYLAEENFDLIIIDEAHHSQSLSYKRFIKRKSELYHEKKMLILGVTATPDRLDGLLLKDIIGACTYSIKILDLITQGFLCDVEGFGLKTDIDLNDVDSRNGDFNSNHLYKKLGTQKRNKVILDICKKEMIDRKTIIFCINIQHSKQICKLLNENGLYSKHIDGTMSNSVKHSILSEFRKGSFSFLCNCQLLTEGFDEPSIDGVILARPTRSKSLFMQMIGRGLRISNGKKNCKIIDIVDNHKNTIGMNNLIYDGFSEQIESFKSIKDIHKYLDNEHEKIEQYKLERISIFDKKIDIEEECTESMISYFKKNNIQYVMPVSFEEGSFIVWYNELRKEFINGLV